MHKGPAVPRDFAIRLLGPVDLSIRGQPTPIPQLAHRVLLAILARSRNRVVSAETLIDGLWQEEPCRRRLNNLHTHVYQLRRQLGEREPERSELRIVTQPPGYRLVVTDGELDLDVFGQSVANARNALREGEPAAAATLYRHALAMWRGPALADVIDTAPSLRSTAEQLEEQRLTALEERMDADLAAGLDADLVSELTGLVALDPLREGLRARLMLCLYRSGRQADALEVYHAARRTLDEELGLDPGPELREMHQRILEGDPDLRPPAMTRLAVSSPEAVANPTLPGRAKTADSERDSPELEPVVPRREAGGIAELKALPGLPQDPSGGSTTMVSVVGAAVAGRPAQLPPDIPEFAGRTEQVSWLRAVLAGRDPAGPVRIAAITGAGGLGKSALAIHAAHQVRDEFPDGQLFIELQGSLDEPLSTGDTLARLLRHLGVSDAAMPKDDAELAAEYRTRVADRRMLIILDDAHDAAQARPLLPGTASSAVLVTSRSWLPDLEGSQLLALDALNDSEALALFAGLCGAGRAAAEPAATAAVLAACAGLPLAVRVAAARLASRPGWQVATLADRLVDEMQRLEELRVGDLAVRTTFQVSYAALPGPASAADDDVARAFRLLGLWPGPDISLPAAAALLGLDDRSAARTLEKLVDIHMLQAPAPARYRFHDLIRLFAAECAEQDEALTSCELAIRRLLSWYLHTAAGVRASLGITARVFELALAPLEAGVIPLTFADYDAAADWSNGEQTHLIAAVVLAARWGLHRICAQLAAVVWHGRLRRPADGWASVFETAIASAASAGERGPQAWLLNHLSVALMHRGSIHDALACLEAALPLSREAGDELCEVKLTAHLAIAFRLLKRYDEAVAHTERALSGTRALDPAHMGRSLSNLGLLYVEVGRLEEGAHCLEESLAVSNKSGDRAYDSLAHAGLADAYRRLGRQDDAIRWAESALETSHGAGDQYQEMTARHVLGQVLADSGDNERARSCLVRARALARSLGVPESAQIEASLAAIETGNSGPA